MMNAFFAVVLAAASATNPDPLQPCEQGRQQIRAKQYAQAIAPLKSCTSLSAVVADGTLDAKAHYLYIIALYFSGRYDDAGQEIAAFNISRRLKVSQEQAAYVDRLGATLYRATPSTTTTTKMQPTLSQDREEAPKDRLSQQAQQEQQKNKPATKISAQESLDLAIEQAAEANANAGPEGARQAIMALDPPYELKPGASSHLAADLPTFEWTTEPARP